MRTAEQLLQALRAAQDSEKGCHLSKEEVKIILTKLEYVPNLTATLFKTASLPMRSEEDFTDEDMHNSGVSVHWNLGT